MWKGFKNKTIWPLLIVHCNLLKLKGRVVLIFTDKERSAHFVDHGWLTVSFSIALDSRCTLVSPVTRTLHT